MAPLRVQAIGWLVTDLPTTIPALLMFSASAPSARTVGTPRRGKSMGNLYQSRVATQLDRRVHLSRWRFGRIPVRHIATLSRHPSWRAQATNTGPPLAQNPAMSPLSLIAAGTKITNVPESGSRIPHESSRNALRSPVWGWGAFGSATDHLSPVVNIFGAYVRCEDVEAAGASPNKRAGARLRVRGKGTHDLAPVVDCRWTRPLCAGEANNLPRHSWRMHRLVGSVGTRE